MDALQTVAAAVAAATHCNYHETRVNPIKTAVFTAIYQDLLSSFLCKFIYINNHSLV